MGNAGLGGSKESKRSTIDESALKLRNLAIAVLVVPLTSTSAISTDMSAPDSPASETLSDSEFDEEEGSNSPSKNIQLKDMKTIAALYKNGVLKAAAATKAQYKPNPSLLERVFL